MAFKRLQINIYQEAILHVLELVQKMKQAAKRQTDIVTVTTEESKDRKKEEKMTQYEGKLRFKVLTIINYHRYIKVYR